MLSKLGEAKGLSGYALEALTTGKPRGSVLAAGTTKQVEGGEALPKETWSHLAFTSDGKTLRLYVEGQLVQTAPAVAVPGTTAPLKIGKGVATWFKGRLDDLRIYDAALSQDAIQADRGVGL